MPSGEPVLALSIHSITYATSSLEQGQGSFFPGLPLLCSCLYSFSLPDMSSILFPQLSLAPQFPSFSFLSLNSESDCVTPLLKTFTDFPFHEVCSFNTTDVLGPLFLLLICQELSVLTSWPPPVRTFWSPAKYLLLKPAFLTILPLYPASLHPVLKFSSKLYQSPIILFIILYTLFKLRESKDLIC